MNRDRRAAIAAIIDAIEEAKEKIDFLMEEEQEYLDNIPENLQNSERYEKASTSVDELVSASDYLSDAVISLQAAIE